jgi:hypothetical protein
MIGDDATRGAFDATRLARAAEELREATAAALSVGSWFAPTLDDCRLDADRLLSLGSSASEAGVHAVLVRADLALRTWYKLAALVRSTLPGPPAAPSARVCPFCGQGSLRPVARAGRTAPFRGLRLDIPVDFTIPTCDACDAEVLDRETAARLDEKLLSAWTWRQR